MLHEMDFWLLVFPHLRKRTKVVPQMRLVPSQKRPRGAGQVSAKAVLESLLRVRRSGMRAAEAKGEPQKRKKEVRTSGS